MKFGICVPNYGESSSPEALRTVALEAEGAGCDSLWTTDHVLMPRNSGTPYERIFDSITTLAYLAPITNRVRLGISSLIIAMRNPVVVAKQLATIDNLAGARIVLAIGAGWNEKEFASLGSNFRNRGRRVDASIRLLRALWRRETSFKSALRRDRKSTRLNSSHVRISYAVFCLKKKKGERAASRAAIDGMRDVALAVLRVMS